MPYNPIGQENTQSGNPVGGLRVGVLVVVVVLLLGKVEVLQCQMYSSRHSLRHTAILPHQRLSKGRATERGSS